MRAIVILSLLLCGAACEGEPVPGLPQALETELRIAATPPSLPPRAAEPLRAKAKAPNIELTAGREITIPNGTLRVGSATGEPHRNPSVEADEVELEIPPFAIDALPYPNDPTQPYRSAVDRDEAEKLCRAEGKRLCHELEWERACKGDAHVSYPHYREGFEVASCQRDLRECVSPFGVLSLGATAREWTASPVSLGLGDSLRTAVVRGAALDAPSAAHRCAARDAATPDSKSGSLIFRCCRGQAPTLAYPTEPAREPFREAAVGHTQLSALLGTLGELANRLQGFRPFTEREIGESLQKASSSRARMAPWVAATGALSWSPVHGEDVVVVAGDTPGGALLIVAHRLSHEKLSLIGTFETAQEHSAIVVAYKPDAPKELLFSSCWGCGGEGGVIAFGEDARIQIAPR